MGRRELARIYVSEIDISPRYRQRQGCFHRRPTGPGRRRQFMQKSFNFTLRPVLVSVLTAAMVWFGAVPAVEASDFITRAVTAYQQGNYDLAIAEFSESIQLGVREAYYGRAKAFYQKGDYNRAIADLDNVIQLQNDSSAAALELRGLAYFKKADYKSAAADFGRVIDLRPGDPQLFLERGDAWFYFGKAGLAFADYNRSIQLNTTNATVYAHRGELYAAYKHDYRKGIVDCLTGISLDPGSWLAYNNLAAMLSMSPYAKIRDGQLAVIHATKACELPHWKNPLPLSVLAAADAENHDFADAIKWQQASMDMDLDMGPDGTRLALNAEKKLELYQNHRPFHASTHN